MRVGGLNPGAILAALALLLLLQPIALAAETQMAPLQADLSKAVVVYEGPIRLMVHIVDGQLKERLDVLVVDVGPEDLKKVCKDGHVYVVAEYRAVDTLGYAPPILKLFVPDIRDYGWRQCQIVRAPQAVHAAQWLVDCHDLEIAKTLVIQLGFSGADIRSIKNDWGAVTIERVLLAPPKALVEEEHNKQHLYYTMDVVDNHDRSDKMVWVAVGIGVIALILGVLAFLGKTPRLHALLPLPLLLLLGLAAAIAHAEVIQLSANMTSVQLIAGKNYTAVAPLVLHFVEPTNITLFIGNEKITTSNVLNVTLKSGVLLQVSKNVTALISPLEEKPIEPPFTPLTSTCFTVSDRAPREIKVAGPVPVTVTFEEISDPYARYYIVVLDKGIEDVKRYGGSWYQHRSEIMNVLAFGVVFSKESVTVKVPAGEHRVGAAVTTCSSFKWRICFYVGGSQQSPPKYRPVPTPPPEHTPTPTPTPPPRILPITPPPSSGSAEGTSTVSGGGSAKTVAIAIGVGIAFIALLVFLATRK